MKPRVMKCMGVLCMLPKRALGKVRHHYCLRKMLIRERATVDIANTDVDNYRSSIPDILQRLFDLKFAR